MKTQNGRPTCKTNLWAAINHTAILLAFIIGFIAGSIATAHAEALCRPKSGVAVRVRTECKKQEVQLDPITLGLQGPAGPTGPQGPEGILPAGFLPTPAFDSGWIELPNHGAVIDVPHNVGGDYNDYFIEASYRRPAENGTLKSHQTAADVIWWEDVTPNNIQIVTNGDVTNNFDAARIRIWIIHQGQP
ncbi:MAG: hypothetical protein AAB367_00285 [Patescibacteria group bacterium]